MKELKIIVGPTGAGKDWLKMELEDFTNIPSITTRAKRPEEINGRDYYFITEEEFQNHIKNGELVEYISIGGKSHGIREDEFLNFIENYSKLLLIVEPNGLIQILKYLKKKKMSCEIKIEIIYLNIGRASRFFNLFLSYFNVQNFTDLYNITRELDKVDGKLDSIPLYQLTENQSNMFQTFEKILERFVRNGDNINDLFICRKEQIEKEMKQIENIYPISMIILNSKKEMNEFVTDYKIQNYSKNYKNLNLTQLEEFKNLINSQINMKKSSRD